NHSITNQVRLRVNQLVRESLPVKTIAKLVGISSTSVQRIIYAHRHALIERRKLPRIICFDEFRSVHSMFSFICIDAITHNLLAILSDRLTKNITAYFLSHYSLSERSQVQKIVMDLNAQYQYFIHRIFPNAQVVIDRFHIIQLAGRALDQARISLLHGIEDHRCRNYKMLKSEWR
ncbi:transposase, partial [Liquorilactobacillus capillatus]